jgi:hypothetical protein
MTFNSVAEIFDDIDSTRAELLRTVEGLSAEQRDFRPSPDRWSVAEIVEHLSLVERSVARLIGSLLRKAEESAREGGASSESTHDGVAHSETGRDGGAPSESGAAFAPVSIAEFVERTSAQKLDAPEAARPAGASVADSLAHLRDTRAALHALRPRVE